MIIKTILQKNELLGEPAIGQFRPNGPRFFKKYPFVKTLRPISLLLPLLASLPAHTQVAIALEKMNVLYVGLDNPLSVAVTGLTDSSLELTPSQGRLIHDGIGHYEWQIHGLDTNQTTLTIRHTPSGDTIGQYLFRIKDLPVRPLFGGQYFHEPMSVGAFKAQGGLAVVIDCCDIDARMRVVSYDLWQLRPGADARLVTNQGARFAAETARLGDDAQPGDTYVFENIVYEAPGGRLKYLTDVLKFGIQQGTMKE